MEFIEGKGEANACDSSDAMRVKWVLPREPGRERRVCGAALGFKGDDTKALLCEKERVGGFDGGESGVKRGESALEVVGVRGCWSSGLLDPLAERESPPS